jgi:hypothetical protein
MKNILYSAAIIMLLTAMSCRKKSPEPTPEPEPAPSGPSYTIPTSYSFTTMDYTTTAQYLDMLGEMTGYIKTAHTTTANPSLNGTKLQEMYNNANSQFTATALNNSTTMKLKTETSNTFSLQTLIDAAMADVGNVTVSTPTASNGVAGKLISGTKAYIVDANGVEYKEYLEKGIMGGVFYYQAINRLLNIGTYDNTTIIAGQGTAQEHAWDVAFGYFGVPAAFPTTTVGIRNWGSYCNSVNSAIGSNTTIMNAFLAGRAAISNKDNSARDAARNTVVATWEKIAAARCITYLKSAKTNIADDALRSHNLSEVIGFIRAFRYNPSKTISDAQLTTLEGYIGTNFYTVTTTNIDNAINDLAGIFGLNANAL